LFELNSILLASPKSKFFPAIGGLVKNRQIQARRVRTFWREGTRSEHARAREEKASTEKTPRKMVKLRLG